MYTNGAKEIVLNTIAMYNTVGRELEDLLQTHGKSKADFEKFMGWENRDFSLIKKLSRKDICKIAACFNIEGMESYLRNFQEDYCRTEQKAMKDYKENKKIFSKLKGAVQLLNGEYTNGLDVLDDISQFFNIEDERDIIQKAKEFGALYRTANFNPDGLNLFAWMRRGELDFRKLNIRSYDRASLEAWIDQGEWKNHFDDTEYFKSLPAVFRNFGAGLIYTPYLDKTVYGAVRWFDGIPLIQISDREKSLAVCWYTLFHEIGHVLLHENDIIFEGEINESKSTASKKESEANAYAYNALFNGDNLRMYIFKRKSEISDDAFDSFVSETSGEFGVHRMFVAYWMLKAQIGRGCGKKYIPGITFA
jgi:Zn-dependent peptidase ImmA (M78 family)